MTTTRTLTHPDELNAAVDFGSPFRVHPDGTVTTYLPDVYAPSAYVYGDDAELEVDGDGWEPVNGYSGQHGYSGPVMHPSEYLGGRMARDVLATPGIYVLVEPSDLDEEDDAGSPDPIGWVLLRQTTTPTPADVTETHACRFCGHGIGLDVDTWVAPDATGDDIVWRDYCPDNDTERAAPHEPSV